jgi:hypothetical protein
MQYGDLPKDLGEIELYPLEVMYYLYLPVSLPGMPNWKTPRQLLFLDPLLEKVANDSPGRFQTEYVYATVKRMFVGGGVTANRPGWHADGFMTDDLNYVWYDCVPTVFNCSAFKITPDHHKSLEEFEAQALTANNVIYPDKRLLRLDQSVVHKVGDADKQVMRTFVKISISKSKYNLQDNSHNYELDYNWPMFNRAGVRNDPHRAQQDSATPQSKLIQIDDHFV